MYYFYDTEFLENGPEKPIEFVSIGMVKISEEDLFSESPRKFMVDTYYAVSKDFNPDNASDWVKENVFPHLNKNFKTNEQIKSDIINFIGNDKEPVFIANFADYDWVVFCQLFGTMIELPKHFPMFCIDMKQICVAFGEPELPQQKDTEHHALNDAMHNLRCYIHLIKKFSQKKFNGIDFLKYNIRRHSSD